MYSYQVRQSSVVAYVSAASMSVMVAWSSSAITISSYDETPRPVWVWGYVSRNALSVAGELVKSQVVVVVWVGSRMVLCVSCVLQFRSCLVDSSDGHGRGPMVSCVVMMCVGVAAVAVRMASGIE